MDNKQYTSLSVIIAIPVIFFLVILLFFNRSSDIQPDSTLVLSPTPSPDEKRSLEPDILKWAKYENEEYNFSIIYPEGWYHEDYSAFHANGGTLIAFSPEPLPCNTCSYFYDGYFSARIYNEKADPQMYGLFIQKMQKTGKDSNISQVLIDGVGGIASGNTVWIENRGWVYEFSLDKDGGINDFTESKIFQKAVSSLKFTHLFNE
jgi:hypothetical protein